MLRCTYIVLIYNHESNIPDLVDSLKKIDGNFRKEYIFVDDGSTDDSLNVLKSAVNDMSRTTIITQENQGPSSSINKAASLATGDYIHFVEGDEILNPESTALLIEASLKLGTQVSVGLVSSRLREHSTVDTVAKLIEVPLNAILVNKLPVVRKIGKSGSLVHSDLLEKIGKADSSIYTQNMSLSLRCAKYSRFAYVARDISRISEQNQNIDSNFDSYNNLKAIYNFTKANPDLFADLIPELLSALSHEVRTRGNKINYSVKSLTSKYIKSLTLQKVLKIYKQELDRLF